MAFRKVAFEQVGGFDPVPDSGVKSSLASDLEFIFRFVNAGLMLRYEPAAAVSTYFLPRKNDNAKLDLHSPRVHQRILVD